MARFQLHGLTMKRLLVLVWLLLGFAAHAAPDAADLSWQLKPRVGIERGALHLHLGMAREAVRQSMAADFGPPVRHRFPEEDDFESPKRREFIRLRFQGGQLHSIMVIRGDVRLGELRLHGGKLKLATVTQHLKRQGHAARETRWMVDGRDFPSLGINMASREDVGGDGDGVEWVMLSRDFQD